MIINITLIALCYLFEYIPLTLDFRPLLIRIILSVLAPGIKRQMAELETSLVIDVCLLTVSLLVITPELSTQPCGQQDYHMVRSQRLGHCAHIAVKEETISKRQRIVKKE